MIGTEMLFKALADGTRQRLLRVLSLEELSVSELVAVLQLPQSTVSRHLKVLREAGLLVDRQLGSAVMYSVRPARREQGQNVPVNDNTDSGDQHGPTHAVALRDRLLEWISTEQLDSGIKERVEHTIRRRNADGEDFFNSIAVRWDQLRTEAFGHTFHLEALTGLLPADWTVADIGTGTGYLLGLLTSRFARVIAVEPAGRMLEVARTRPELNEARNVEFREGSLLELPLADGEVDLAIASLVLHHVDDPQQALKQLRRCVRVGGKLLIIEQEAHQYVDFYERMGDQWWGFGPETLAEWVTEAGFSDVRHTPMRNDIANGRRAADAPSLYFLTASAEGA